MTLSVDRRRERFEAREVRRSISADGRAEMCGRLAVRESGVQLRVSAEGVAGLAGLGVCARVHTCPCCSARILAERTREIQGAIARWLEMHPEGAVGMLTLTVRHGPRSRLAQLLDGMAAAMREMTKSSEYRSARKRAGWRHQIRAFEARWGAEHGWHPHFHTLIFFDEAPGDDALKDLAGKVFWGWQAACKKAGLRAGIRAQDLRLFDGPIEKVAEDAGAYVGKHVYAAGLADDAERALAVALEISRGDLKRSRREGSGATLSPFEILSALVRDLEESGGDRDTPVARLLIRRWHEWEKATKGRRVHYWSRGLRQYLALGESKSDEEAASEETGTADDAVLEISGRDWQKFARRCTSGAVGLLEATEAGWRADGRAGARQAAEAFLRARRVRYRPPMFTRALRT